jgi:ABC-type nitrate/sulfonate/bicarbonate transport system substrate-binding protein
MNTFLLLPRLRRFALHLSLSCVAGLAASPACRAADTLTIAVTPSMLSLPVDVAQAQGYFAAEGVDVRVSDCSSGPRCMQQLFERAAQLVTVTEFPVVSASFERNDYAIVSTIATATGNIRLLGRKSAGVHQVADLLGKRIGVIFGTSSHYYLNAYLLFHDIDPKQVQLVPLLPEAIPEAVAQRRVDALAGYSRHVGPALKALGRDGVLLDDPHIYTEIYNLVADRRTLARRGADIAKILRALDRAQRFIAENPASARQILASRTTLDPQLTSLLDQRLSYRLGLDQSLIAAMEGEARWAVREGHVPNRPIPNYLGFIDFGPLRTGVPAALPR